MTDALTGDGYDPWRVAETVYWNGLNTGEVLGLLGRATDALFLFRALTSSHYRDGAVVRRRANGTVDIEPTR